MFGVFQGGLTSNRSSLPQLQDLVMVYETPADLRLTLSNTVYRLNNSAPFYGGQFSLTSEGTEGAYFSDTGGPADQDTMFGLVDQPGWEMSNAALGAYSGTGNIVSSTPSGFTVFTIMRQDVPGTTFCWQLTPAGSGDTISFFASSWNDAGTPRPRFRITTTSGTTITKDEYGYGNGSDYRRFHCFATDFTGGATGAEYNYTSGLKSITTGGTLDTLVQTTGPNNPDSSYQFKLGEATTSRPRVMFQAIYVWKRKLTAGEIAQVNDYVNNNYIQIL